MKTHLVVSTDPLNFLSNGEMVGLCGAQVAHAKPIASWAIADDASPEFNTLRDCSRCIEKACELLTSGQQRYLYAIVPGEEALHSGDTLNNLRSLVDRHLLEDDCA